MTGTPTPHDATGSGRSLGQIELRDLRVMGVHGVLPEERERAQPFSIDVDLVLDMAAAAASDALEDTVDYGALSALAASVVADQSFQLLEALADTAAIELLAADRRIQQVTVTVRKLRPPVPLDLGSAGARVTWTRDTAAS